MKGPEVSGAKCRLKPVGLQTARIVSNSVVPAGGNHAAGTGINDNFVFLSVFDDFDIVVRTAVVSVEVDVGNAAADTCQSRFSRLCLADQTGLCFVFMHSVRMIVVVMAVVVGECGRGNAQQCGCGDA